MSEIGANAGSFLIAFITALVACGGLGLGLMKFVSSALDRMEDKQDAKIEKLKEQVGKLEVSVARIQVIKESGCPIKEG